MKQIEKDKSNDEYISHLIDDSILHPQNLLDFLQKNGKLTPALEAKLFFDAHTDVRNFYNESPTLGFNFVYLLKNAAEYGAFEHEASDLKIIYQHFYDHEKLKDDFLQSAKINILLPKNWLTEESTLSLIQNGNILLPYAHILAILKNISDRNFNLRKEMCEIKKKICENLNNSSEKQ